MTVTVSHVSQRDRAQWEVLYHGYAKFYQAPMNDEILDSVWSWIHDESEPFFGLIAKEESGNALGLMHCRQMASPLRGAHVGFLDDLFVKRIHFVSHIILCILLSNGPSAGALGSRQESATDSIRSAPAR